MSVPADVLVVGALASSGSDVNTEDRFPIWLVDAAVITGFVVGWPRSWRSL